MVTWQTFTAQLPSQNLQALATFVRDSFGNQGRPLTFLQFLTRDASTPNLADADTAALTGLWKALLLVENRATVDDYKQYVDLFEQPEQPLAAAFAAALEQAGIAYGAFKDGGADEQVDDLLRAGSSTYWSATRQALQLRGQRFVDEQGRLGAFAEAVGATWQAATTQLLDRIRAKKAYASLFSIAQTPLNRLAQDISPLVDNSDPAVPAVSTEYFNLLLQQLIDLAKQVVAENYTPELEAETFLSSAPISREATQAVLQVLAEKPAAAIAALATTSVSSLQPQLTDLLPANSPLVYAVAQSFQNQVTQFLQGLAPADVGEPTEPAAIRQLDGRLTETNGKPLANFGVRLTQSFMVGPSVVLGEVFTSPDGHFPLRVRQEYTLSGEEVISPLATQLTVAVFALGQPFSAEPAEQHSYEVPLTQSQVVVGTALSADLPPVESQSLTDVVLPASLPPELTSYLSVNLISSLADIRRLGGLLNRADVPADDAVQIAVRQLDGLARFEVISPDTALHTELVQEGLYSPQQLLTQTTREDLVQLLASPDDPRWHDPQVLDDRRRQVAAFYEQTSAVEALTKTVGLFAAAEKNAGLGTEPILLFPADSDQEPVAPGDEFYEDTSNYQRGEQPQQQYNPAPNGIVTTYQSAQQCDCAACRSAVGPTAYLAALLQYAQTNLRTTPPTQPVNPLFLQTALLQPFNDLTLSCQYAEEKVCKYRLAIEVIQASWRTRTAPGRALTFADGQPYVKAILETLLQDLGTSTQELLAAGADEARGALETRLRLPAGAVTALQQRFGSTALAATRLLDAIEDDLEQVFGLASTARDPLSTGSKLAPASPPASAVQLLRWNFQGVHWDLNAGLDGLLHLEVLVDPATTNPKHQLTVYKNSKSEDTVVARGNFVARAAAGSGQQFTASLYSQHGSELRGSVLISISAPSSDAPLVNTVFNVSVIPAITAWRLQFLTDEWGRQDAATVQQLQSNTSASWNGFLFLIDPDVLGPDDFRPLGQPLSPLNNPAYQLWLNRFNFLNDQRFIVNQMPDYFGAILDDLSVGNVKFQYGNTAPRKAWATDKPGFAGLSGTALLQRVQASLQSADADQMTKALAVLSDLGLAREAFEQLYALWQKSIPTGLLEAAEEEVFYTILRQTLKKTFALVWAQEERTNQIVLNGQWFQTAIHEPQEGVWVKAAADEFDIDGLFIPRLDPDEVTPLDLPDPGFFGNYAAQVWRNRKAQLQAKQLAIVASGAAENDPLVRANTMLEYAYRTNPAGPNTPSTTPPYSTLELIWAASQDESDAKNPESRTYFNTTLALRPKEAEQLMALRSQVRSSATAASWQEMAKLLTLGWKRAVAYQQPYWIEGYPNDPVDSWFQVERDEIGPLFPQTLLMTRKQRLVKWRASAAGRANWVTALRQAFKRPLIDPDQLVANDFRQAGERSRNVSALPSNPGNDPLPFVNPAFDLFSQRASVVAQWYENLRTSLPASTATLPAQQAAYQALVAAELGATWNTVSELYRQLQQNVDVTADLARLNLTSTGLNALVQQAVTPDAAQIPAFLHLLVQVRKIRRYADWQREEVTRRLPLVPRYFREPQPEAVPLPSLPWRSSLVERRTMLKTLTARYAQALATVEVQTQAVKSAEDEYLPLLRDVLLDYKVGQGNSRETKADNLSNKYLLDFKIACCQHTTRVAQGIDVLQKLYFNLRSSLTSAIPGLALNGSYTGFDADWQWLGSYERWRSLMFLYLYPENVLLPALKPQQTTPFKDLVSNTRQTAQLTPSRAASLFQAYERDFLDIAILNLVASAQCYVAPNSASLRELTVFQIAYASVSKRAYWNTYFTRSGAGLPPELNWKPLPGAAQVERVVGTCVFQNTAAERHLCVLAFISNEHRSDTATGANSLLAIQRLNLVTWEWDEDFKILDYSDTDTVEINNVLLISGQLETWPPIISGLRKRKNMTLSDMEEFPFRYNYVDTRPRDLTSLGDTRLRQAELFQLRLADDSQSVLQISSALLVGFNDFDLGAAVMTQHTYLVRGDTVQYFCFYKKGRDAADYELTGFKVEVPEAKPASTPQSPVPLSVIIDPAISNVLPPMVVILGTWFRTQFNALLNNTTSGAYSYSLIEMKGLGRSTFPVSIFAATSVSPLNVGAAKPKSIGATLVARNYGGTFFEANGSLFDFYFETGNGNNSVCNRLRIYISYTFSSPSTDAFIDSGFVPLSERLQYVGPPVVSATNVNELGASLPYLVSQKESVLNAEVLRTFNISQPTGTPWIMTTVGSTSTFTVPTVAYGTPVVSYTSTPQLPPLRPVLAPGVLETRRVRLATILAAVTNSSSAVLNGLIWEGYYYVPLFLSMELYRAKYYEEALRYSRLFYDYTQATLTSRTIFPGLHDTNAAHFDTVMAWLADASNPHTLVGLRRDSHLRFAVVSIVRCIIGYGDSEFSRDTVESVPRARSLYELAVVLLKQDILFYDVQDCYAILNQLDLLVIPAWAAQWQEMKDLLAMVNQREVILNILDRPVGGNTRPGIIELFTLARQPTGPKSGKWAEQFNEAWQLINADLAALIGKYETLSNFQTGTVALPAAVQRTGLLDQNTLDAVSQALSTQVKQRFNAVAKQIKEQSGEADYSWLAQREAVVIDPDQGGPVIYSPAVTLQLALNATRPFVPFLNADFCVPTNPVPYALQLQAELNLYKIRTCRNIAGIQRELDPYAAPTDTTSGLPAIGANGQLSRTGRLVVPATQYRYAYIIERARQLVSLAQQAEASLLSALEKRDSEAYNLLKARQDISVSKATIQLQNLRSQEAEDGIDLAGLQLQRSELMESQYDEWLNAGLSSFEQDMLNAIELAGSLNQQQTFLQGQATAASTLAGASAWGVAVAGISATLTVLASFAGASAIKASTQAQISQNRASFERRAQEWTFQRNLATKDIQIGQQQITLADDRLRIVGQEKRISELQLDNAEAVLNFLTTKFTNAELYDWMSQILESAYSYFLQQATATARTAELQLAFERQEAPAGLVQEDYWTPPTENTAVSDNASASTVDRKGLTGSIRLLQDLTRLDQYAFETNRRKLQLTKTVSLAQDFPTEFVRFRETGVLAFAIPQASFDQDFPGHYLRIVRRVRTSVIALVPPTEGIKAKLTTAGNSRVVVAGTPFQMVTLPRPPESVSLTAPINASGLFELEQQPGELLYPFEGTGVDVPWTFSFQPAANTNLDFASIADVLITMDYTALESYDYGQQVVKSMSPERQQMVALSFRNRFADQWYDLHHAADLTQEDKYKARFTITAADLPLNLRNASLRSISIYFDVPTDDEFQYRIGLDVAFTRSGSEASAGVASTNTYGLISTRTGSGNGPIYTGNAGALTALIGSSPVGDWVLNLGLSNALRARLDAGKVNDVYLILEVEGDAPAYTLV